MKTKHNKKRNTAFVYEALVREITVAIIKNDSERKNKAINIVKKHFKPNSVLRKHLDCYRSLYESQDLDEKTSEKIIREARMASRLLDTQGLFVGHSNLIDDVNTQLSPQVFNNFVPNYKTLATIDQLFSLKTTPKTRVMLETQLIDTMTSQAAQKQTMQPIDNLVITSFVSKFNDKYQESLSEEQNTILNLYISSFSDNSLELKSFLNEEIARLKEAVAASKSAPEVAEDKDMINKAQKVEEMLEGFASQQIDDGMLVKILKTQELVKELTNDVSDD